MWKTVGHERAVRRLQRAIEQDRLAHAYLIVGPPRIGKTTLALDLARAANCLGNRPPCGECRQCERIAAGLHPDVRTIGLEIARSGRLRTLVSIEQVRDVQRDTSLRPYEGRHRVFIFESAERLSEEAANSLLKTLEEPPDSVILVLVASDISAVLPTISSRCQRLDLKPVPGGTIVDLLQSRYAIGAEQAQEIAGAAAGRVGWAIQAADEPTLLDQVKSTLDTIESVLDGPLTTRFDYAERLAAKFSTDREGVFNELGLWLSWWRDVLLIGQQRPELVSHVSRTEKIEPVAERLPAESVTAAIRAVNQTLSQLERNVTPRLSIEGMMLQMPH